MNLYQIMTKHYAPKDGRKSIYCYLISESNETVYEWLKEENRFDDEIDNLYLSWSDMEHDDGELPEDYEGQSYESFKKQMIKLNDEEKTDNASYDDLYYGRTFVSWKLVKEDVKQDILQNIKDYGIRIFDSRKELI